MSAWESLGDPDAAEVESALSVVQLAQHYYDSILWDVTDPGVVPDVAKLRHVLLHLTVTTGKLARLLEPLDHDDHHRRNPRQVNTDDVMPIVADLILHGAQIANAFDLDLGRVFTARYRQNGQRLAPGSRLVNFGLRGIGT